MKKQILELLRELQKHTGMLCIEYFSDHSGVVKDAIIDKRLIIFNSEKQLIQGLKDKIKELKK